MSDDRRKRPALKTADERFTFVRLLRQSDIKDIAEVVGEESIPHGDTTFHFPGALAPNAGTFPAIRVVCFEKAVVRPKSDFVEIDEGVVIPDTIDLARHLMFDTLQGSLIPLPGGRVALLRREPPLTRIEKGFLLLSWASVNWAHFLTEVLPLAVLAERAGLPSDLPFLVPTNLHPNMRSLVETVATSSGRGVVPIEGVVKVGVAVGFSSVSTVAFDFLASNVDVLPEFVDTDMLYSPSAIRLTREFMRASFLSTEVRRRRIFLDRRAGCRRILNAGDVVDFFTVRGFEVISPEGMSAEAQVKVFAEAAIIVAQAGAGVANMIFAKEGCRVVILTTDQPFNSYNYFSNLAAVLGHELHYIGFDPVPVMGMHLAHSDFTVDLKTLSALSRLWEYPLGLPL